MLKKLALLIALAYGTVLAQTATGTIDSYTGNIVYTTVNPPPQGADQFSWSGFGTTYSNGGGYSGGYQPAWNPTTGTFMFGYNQGTVAYTTPVNFALSHAGTGIQVTGLKYSWEYYNQGEYKGTLSSNISLTSNIGQTLQSYNYNMPYTTAGWTTMSGRETFNTQYAPSSLGTLNVSFTGKDDKWWAGYYGPQVRAIDVGLTYGMASPPPVPTDFLRWIPLVNENDTFTLNTAGVVRYGAQGVYEYKSFQPGTYDCSNSAWGNDPIGGVGKSCSVGSNTTTTTPTVPKTTTTDYSTVALLDPVTTTTTNTTSTATIVTDPIVTTTPSATTSSPTSSQPSVVTAVVSAPAPATSSTTSSSSTSSSTQSTKETSSSGGSTSLALSIISKNSDRDAAGSAVAQAAVAQAQATANQAQQEAQSVAANAVANSTTNNAASSGGQQSSGNGIRVNNNNSNSTNFTLQSGLTSLASVVGGPQQSSNTTFVQQQNSSGTGLNVSNNQPVIVVNTGQQQANTEVVVATYTLPLLQPQVPNSVIAPIMFAPVEQPQVQQQTVLQSSGTSTQSIETYASIPPNFLTDKSNPLTDIIEGKNTVPQNSTIATTGPSVNKNTGDNDVAGGVDINKMALAPTGYGDYLNLVLRDAAFYAPKEVYRNQRNVDNARALRQLSSDSKHREMVELQYAK